MSASLAHIRTMVSPPLALVKRYERPLSAISMVAGFAFDNYYFGRVDHPATQIVIFAYLALAIVTILLLHYADSREERGDDLLTKIHPLVIGATQFAFGALWSAFLIFYGRSAVIDASWPFLLVLAAVMIGSEVFRHYQDRLVFTCGLLFFALFSYAMLALPVFTGTMGQRTFLMSGAIATGVFIAIILLLFVIGYRRMVAAWRGITMTALGILATINAFYFASILPPLPLALANAGVFHQVTKVGDAYEAISEEQPWYRWAGARPIFHAMPGESVYLYSAVFAPIQLKTNIVHLWQRYDETSRRWLTESRIRFTITGGREGGYRGYSIKATPRAGQWRVDIATSEGLLIGRVPFVVANAIDAPNLTTQMLP